MGRRKSRYLTLIKLSPLYLVAAGLFYVLFLMDKEVDYLAAARDRYQAHRNEEALKLVEQALEEASSNRGSRLLEALELQARILARMRGYGRAIADLDRIVQLRPDSPEALDARSLKGEILIQKGDFKEALQVYEALLREPRVRADEEKRIDCQSRAGATAYNLSSAEAEEASTILRRNLPDPETELEALDRFVVDLDRNNDPEALKILLSERLSEEGIRRVLELASEANRNYRYAYQLLREFEVRPGFNALAADFLVHILYRSRRWLPALLEANLALKEPLSFPRRVGLLQVTVDIYYALGRYEKAAEVLESILGSPDRPDPRLRRDQARKAARNLLLARLESGDYDWILSRKRAFQRLLGKDPTLQYALGASYFAKKAPLNAAPLLEEVLQLIRSGKAPFYFSDSPAREDCLRLLHDVYLKIRARDKALEVLNLAVHLYPQELEFLYERARLLERELGRPEEAAKDYRRLLEAGRRSEMVFQAWSRTAELNYQRLSGSTYAERAAILVDKFERQAKFLGGDVKKYPQLIGTASFPEAAEEPLLRLAISNEFLARGYREQAKSMLRMLVREVPGILDFSSRLGDLYLQEGSLEAARRAYERILEKEPNNFDALRKVLRCYRGLGDAVAEGRRIRTVLQGTEPDLRKWMLARLLFDAGQYEDFFKMYGSFGSLPRAVRKDLELLAARAWIEQKRFDRAAGIVNPILEQDPENLEALKVKARLLAETEPAPAADKTAPAAGGHGGPETSERDQGGKEGEGGALSPAEVPAALDAPNAEEHRTVTVPQGAAQGEVPPAEAASTLPSAGPGEVPETPGNLRAAASEENGAPGKTTPGEEAAALPEARTEAERLVDRIRAAGDRLTTGDVEESAAFLLRAERPDLVLRLLHGIEAFIPLTPAMVHAKAEAFHRTGQDGKAVEALLSSPETAPDDPRRVLILAPGAGRTGEFLMDLTREAEGFLEEGELDLRAAGGYILEGNVTEAAAYLEKAAGAVSHGIFRPEERETIDYLVRILCQFHRLGLDITPPTAPPEGEESKAEKSGEPEEGEPGKGPVPGDRGEGTTAKKEPLSTGKEDAASPGSTQGKKAEEPPRRRPRFSKRPAGKAESLVPKSGKAGTGEEGAAFLAGEGEDWTADQIVLDGKSLAERYGYIVPEAVYLANRWRRAPGEGVRAARTLLEHLMRRRVPGFEKECRALAETMLEHYPGCVTAARYLLEEGVEGPPDSRRVVKYLKPVITVVPDDPRVLSLLAPALAEQKVEALSRACLKRLQEMGKGRELLAKRVEAEVRLAQGSTEEALRLCREILQEKPKDRSLLLALVPTLARVHGARELKHAATLLEGEGLLDDEAARRLVEAVKTLPPDDEGMETAEALMDRVPAARRVGLSLYIASAAAKRGDRERLLELADTLPAFLDDAQADRADLYAALGTAAMGLATLGETDRACELLEYQYFLRPAEAAPLDHLAAIHQRAGRVARATQYLELFNILRPWDLPHGLLLVKNWFFKLGEFQKAERLLAVRKAYVREDPALAFRILVGSAVLQGDPKEIQRRIDRYRLLEGVKTPENIYLIALVYYFQGRDTKALRLFRMMNETFKENRYSGRVSWFIQKLEDRLKAEKRAQAMEAEAERSGRDRPAGSGEKKAIPEHKNAEPEKERLPPSPAEGGAVPREGEAGGSRARSEKGTEQDGREKGSPSLGDQTSWTRKRGQRSDLSARVSSGPKA